MMRRVSFIGSQWRVSSHLIIVQCRERSDLWQPPLAKLWGETLTSSHHDRFWEARVGSGSAQGFPLRRRAYPTKRNECPPTTNSQCWDETTSRSLRSLGKNDLRDIHVFCAKISMCHTFNQIAVKRPGRRCTNHIRKGIHAHSLEINMYDKNTQRSSKANTTEKARGLPLSLPHSDETDTTDCSTVRCKFRREKTPTCFCSACVLAETLCQLQRSQRTDKPRRARDFGLSKTCSTACETSTKETHESVLRFVATFGSCMRTWTHRNGGRQLANRFLGSDSRPRGTSSTTCPPICETNTK